MRSINGPDILPTYLWICIPEHLHSRPEPKYPQGHGFIEATSVKFAGNVSDDAAREIVTCLSSIGWRRTSSTLRSNSGSSSRKSTPRCAKETSPGRGIEPPPINPACDTVWCGDLNGRSSISPALPVSPATE